jgi:hypothetical protein
MNLQDQELNNPYSLTNIIRAMKSRKAGWAEHEMHMGEMINS